MVMSTPTEDSPVVPAGLDTMTPTALSQQTQLVEALRHLLSEQGYPIDNIRLQDVIGKHQNATESGALSPEQVFDILQEIGVSDIPEVLRAPDAAVLPLLAYHNNKGWGVIDSLTPQKRWHFRQVEAQHHITADSCTLLLRIRLQHTPNAQSRRSFYSWLTRF